MVQAQSNLYEISMSGGQELMWYHADVKRGNNVFIFEIYQASDTVSVFFVDKGERLLSIASTEEMMTMLAFDEDKRRYRNIVKDAEWVLLDGIASQRGMTKEEESAFLYLKENVLEEMAASL
ncbi:hypothetical protein QUF99_15050 [Bacillus sp. DX4.1]|uniref:hypothetical protein n=1 Tax=Bacillus sp. DX4.1 TaxID=3055867 RepID=UPI0025A27BF2|nr:hypothetical protein [Bacillus sp. DX4.1]MDM5188585.1 hypothetical protein [Bacillus sp. DX4.1]